MIAEGSWCRDPDSPAHGAGHRAPDTTGSTSSAYRAEAVRQKGACYSAPPVRARPASSDWSVRYAGFGR